MVSRYLQCFFLKFSVCLGPSCSNFNVFLSVFCGKVVQNENAEDYAEEVTNEAIDGP